MPFLDRLQKSAHQSELDYSNTSPWFFCFLVASQVVAAVCLGRALSERFLLVALLGIGFHWIGFVSSLLLGTNKFYDITEDVCILHLLACSYFTVSSGAPNLRTSLVYLCALIWCIRLVVYVGYRVLVRGHDFRFEKLNKGVAYNFFAWTSGGVWCFFNFFSLWKLADDTHQTLSNGLDIVDYIGFFIFGIGLYIETVADIEKWNFNAAFKFGENDKWISTGMWSYSRHPNYCGEVMVWVGLSICCIGGMKGLTRASAAELLTYAVSPVWSCVFLVFTSLMLLEKRADQKWGGIKTYENYKTVTPVLFPGL
jgi:steroid 5-alpha reductase family enzyme